MVFPLIIVAVAGYAGLILFRYRRARPGARALRKAWAAAAHQTALQLIGRRLPQIELRGERNEQDTLVRLSLADLDFNPFKPVTDTTAFSVTLGPTFPTDFSAGATWSSNSADTDVPLGDGTFDARVAVHGQPASILAVAGAEARAALTDAVGEEITVSAGALHLQVAGVVCDPDALAARIARLHELAQIIAGAGSLRQRIVRNASLEHNATVLRAQLAALARLVGDEPVTRDERSALRAHLQSGDARVRVLAARLLGAEGHPTLIEAAGMEALPPTTRALAVAGLGDVPRTPEIESAFRAAVGPLGGGLSADRSSSDACAAALAVIGGRTAESLLLLGLERSGPETRRAIAEALGAVGMARSVGPLARWTERPPIDYACQSAIAAIQQRLGKQAAGGLTLIDPAAGAGQLALTGEAGGVSLSEPDLVPAEPEVL